jgi:hypothetical protein
VDDATHEMAKSSEWCVLIQRVSEHLEYFEQEVINAGDDYPGLVLPA